MVSCAGKGACANAQGVSRGDGRAASNAFFDEGRLLVDRLERKAFSETGLLKTALVSRPEKLKLLGINHDAAQRMKEGKRIKPSLAVEQHERMCEVLDKEGVELLFLPPNPESVYTRDIGFVIGNEFYRASMKEEVRRVELDAVRGGVEFAPPGGFLEGGDVLLCGRDKEVFVGMGERTTVDSVLALQRVLGSEWTVTPLRLRGDELHLDCAFAVLAKNRAVFCPSLFTDERDLRYLRRRFRLRIEVSEQEAKGLATNFVHLSPDTILTRKTDDGKSFALTDALRKFYRVIEVDYSEMAKGTGSVRCSTLPLNREG